MSKKGLYEEIKILAEKKIKDAKEKHDIELSSTVDELSNKTKSEHDDIDTDYYKYILGQDYDEIVKSTDQELKSKNIDLNKLNLMKSDEGSSTMSTTKMEKFSSDSDASSFEERIEKLLTEEKNITYQYEQKSKTDKSSISNQEIAESTSISAESFISYKAKKLRSVDKLEDQMEMLEQRLVKLKEQREAEGKQQTKPEERTKSPKVAEERTKLSKVAEERIKSSKMAEERIKSSKVAEERIKSSKVAEERIRSSKVAEERIKSSKVAEEQTKSPNVTEERIKSPKVSEERMKSSKVAEERIKSSKVAEEQTKSPNVTEERIKLPKVSEERIKSSKVAEEHQKVSLIQKHSQKLEEKQMGKPVKLLKEQQEIQEVQDIENKGSNEAIRQKLNDFLDSSENLLTQAESKSKLETQLIQKRLTPSGENTPTNIAAILRETKETVNEDEKSEYDKNRIRALKGAESRQSTRSGYSRRISFDSTQCIQSPDMILNEPIEESKVEEEFQINEQLLSRMLEENKLMAMKIHQNRFQDDKSVQLSFIDEHIDEHIDENIEFSLSDDMTMSKKLSCTVVKPITKLFKRKNLSFSDAEVRKIECENKHLESRIREMMKKGSGLSYNPSAKYCVQASSSINRRKHEAKTCRENLKIERKIRDIKRKSNEKAPWAVPVWI